MTMKAIISVIIITILTSCTLQSSLPQGDWTIMFYLGDDYSTIGLTADVIELTSKSVNTSSNRIFILYDGPEYGDSKLEILDSPFGVKSRIIDLKNTSIRSSDNELDMNNPETLRSFINYTKSKSPAANYALYFGSHGTGFTDNFPSGLAIENELTINSSMLEITEIASVLEQTGGQNLVVFDACLQGNVETIYEFKNSVDYIVASPEETAGPGNDYSGVITRIFSNQNLTPYALGKETIESYYDNYAPLNYILPTSNNLFAKDILQLYNVKKISEILENVAYNSLATTSNTGPFTAQPGSSIDTFNTNGSTNQYINIFGVIEANAIYINDNSIITKPNNGLYKFISIYKPNAVGNYNAAYENTKFAQTFPAWVTKITTP